MRSESMPPQKRRSLVRFSALRVSTLAFSAITLALASGVAWAQAAPALKIGVIDMQSALLSTKDGQKAVNELKAKFAPKQQEFEKRESELKGKQDLYRKTENTISEEAKAALARDIDAMTKSLQRDNDDARQDLEQEQQRVLSDLMQKMQQVIQKYSNEKGLTMVFDLSGQPNNVVFASNTIEITRDIIAMYDAAAPVTPTKPPASPASAAPKPPAPRPATPAAPAPKQ